MQRPAPDLDPLMRERLGNRRRMLFGSYAEAARDPEFQAGMQKISRAFESTAPDGLGWKLEETPSACPRDGSASTDRGEGSLSSERPE
jgi:hypothetical protein